MIRIIIFSGVHLFHLPEELKTKIRKDLTFDNPQYVNAKRYGKFSNPNMRPHLFFYAEVRDQDVMYIPKGYFYFLFKHIKELKLPYILEDKTTVFPKLDLKFYGKPREYQDKAILDIKKYPIGVLESGTGCLVGDTQIRLNRGKKGYVCSLELAYKQFNGIKMEQVKFHNGVPRSMGVKGWNPEIETFIRSYNHHQKRIVLNKVEDIVYSGIKPVYQIVLKGGKEVRATGDHKIMTSKGWKKLLDLELNDLIMTDNPNPKKLNSNKSKLYGTYVCGLIFHPYALKTKKRGKVIYRKSIHVLTKEADINGLTLAEITDILKNDQNRSRKLRFIDSSKYDVHHVDGNHLNDDPSNLELLLKSKHKKTHASSKNFNQGDPSYLPIIKRKYIGKMKTYDICCKSPYNNFTANDIVVHNSGKTYVGIKMIEERQQPCLIIVHSKELLSQWTKAIKELLRYDAGNVGNKIYNIEDITVGIVNTVKNNIEELKSRFGFVIVDETHRCPASTFTHVLSKITSRYQLGLSATMIRSDGLGYAINAYIGPKIHKVSRETLHEVGAVLIPEIIRKETGFQYFYDGVYAKMLSTIAINTQRNNLICNDISQDIRKYKSSILVVSDRVHHLELIYSTLLHSGVKAFLLTSLTPKEERDMIIETMASTQGIVLLSTVQLIGEGFDCPNLNALFLASPIKYKGRLIQVIGRILRPCEGFDPRIYDYRDSNVKPLKNAAKERDKCYRMEWKK